MKTLLTILLGVILLNANAQSDTYSHADTIRGSITPERAWWDLLHYELQVKADPEEMYISGTNTITYKVLKLNDLLQIDLQLPMQIRKVMQDGNELYWFHEGENAYQIKLRTPQKPGETKVIKIWYEGNPVVAKRAPWDGGLSWSQDKSGKPFFGTSCQGLGASVWWPCKDHMYDEPDNGVLISVNVPKGIRDVSNGTLIKDKIDSDSSRTSVWEVKNPINNYGVNINVANYTFWKDTYKGLKGDLPLSFYVLPENLEKAKVQFNDVYRMLEAFEYWFGPYPFYEDGYKLVEVPYLGMEHQSSVTYGNGFKNGYLGRDLSETGWGLKWDFIIVHESGHEWFANNITYKDQADMWIHESFTNYSENLFVEYFYGKEAGAEYVRGTRKLIENKEPMISTYGVNSRSGIDIYYKGGNMLHTLRQVIANDEKWRSVLVGLNKEFYHQTVETKQIEDYLSEQSGMDLSYFFNQYLRTKNVPTLEWKQVKKKIEYRWTNCNADFKMPLDVKLNTMEKRIYPTTEWQKLKGKNLFIDPDYYIFEKKDRN